MAQKTEKPFLFRIIYSVVDRNKKQSASRKKKQYIIGKRQKFSIGVGIASFILMLTDYILNGYGILTALFLAIFSDIILYWAIKDDLKQNFSPQVFILPFLYSLSFGLFSFLTPARLFTHVILDVLFAVGLYSVFLSENIFAVASIRTIQLLNSARIVSLVISLVAYFFLASTAFSLRVNVIPTTILLFLFSTLFSMHAIWTYTLEKSLRKDISWTVIMSLCLSEFGIILWFWPTTPIIVALFLTSMWYVFVGLSHVWLDKRLFRNVLWEYIWVSVIGLLVIISFTQWQ